MTVNHIIRYVHSTQHWSFCSTRQGFHFSAHKNPNVKVPQPSPALLTPSACVLTHGPSFTKVYPIASHKKARQRNVTDNS